MNGSRHRLRCTGMAVQASSLRESFSDGDLSWWPGRPAV